MEVFDYSVQNKGAAVITHEVPNNAHPFTYFLDEAGENLHIYCDNEKDKWINYRDNGTARNTDASIVARLMNKNTAIV